MNKQTYKVPKLCLHKRVTLDKTETERESLIRKFARNADCTEAIVEYCKSHVEAIDDKLHDTDAVFDKSDPHNYMAALLAKQKAYLDIINNLTDLHEVEVDVDPTRN